jgi:AsmA protein
MKKMIKWFGIIIGGLVVLVVLILLIAPMFVDLQKFKPTIENTVAEATGRNFVLGGDIELSLFPWAGVTLKDVALGNPDGFDSGSFAEFSEFEVRMKLLPLISGDVQVKHVVLKGLRLVLEKNVAGQANWEFTTAGAAGVITEPAPEAPEQAPAEKAGDAQLPIKTLAVGEISVTGGSVLYIDRQSDVRKELSDVDIRIANISFDTPMEVNLSGKLDNQPFSLAGSVGPVGSKPGEGDIGLDLTAKAFDILELELKGTITDPATAPAYRMHVAMSPFSPKRLLEAIAPESVPAMSDPNSLEKFGLEVDIAGDTGQVALTDGKMVLDDTTTTFQMAAKDFSKPDIAWDVKMDSIDLDRYLPETEPGDEPLPEEGGTGQVAGPGQPGDAVEAAEIDYTPLRTLVLDGNVEVGELKAGGGTFRNIVMKVAGAGGKIKIDPFSLDLYEGSLQVLGNVDVTGKKPKSAVDLNLEGVQVEPLLKDFLEKDFITGTTLARISLAMTGDTPDEIKKSLGGKGDLQFNDGAIRNVNLLDMIQNIQAAFGSGGAAQSNETRFSEFQSQFTITNGVVNTSSTTVSSPVLRVEVTGSADLVKESLDFKVNPPYINPKNQKESGMSISGTQVPVLVSGTFSEPKFRPDVGAAAEKVVTEQLTEKLGEMLGGSGDDASEDGEDSIEDSVKGILKGLPFGR